MHTFGPKATHLTRPAMPREQAVDSEIHDSDSRRPIYRLQPRWTPTLKGEKWAMEAHASGCHWDSSHLVSSFMGYKLIYFLHKTTKIDFWHDVAVLVLFKVNCHWEIPMGETKLWSTGWSSGGLRWSRVCQTAISSRALSTHDLTSSLLSPFNMHTLLYTLSLRDTHTHSHTYRQTRLSRTHTHTLTPLQELRTAGCGQPWQHWCLYNSAGDMGG